MGAPKPLEEANGGALQEADRILAETEADSPSSVLLLSDQVFKEIEMTIQAKPEEASKVNTVYLFIIKQGGTPVKRWLLDLRSSPVSLAASLPTASLVASPDCSVICDDKDFF